MNVSMHCHPLPQSFHAPEDSSLPKSAQTLRDRLILKRYLGIAVGGRGLTIWFIMVYNMVVFLSKEKQS